MTDPIHPTLRAAVGLVARVPQLLVACDYDGTLAPTVADPTQAAPLPEAVAAVRALAALPQTTVAVVSGRALRDLATLSRLPSEVHLVGSHGSEFDIGFVHRLAPELLELRTRLQHAVEVVVRDQPGVRLEPKPASIAVHVRTAAPAVAEEVVAALRAGPASWPEIHVTSGNQVLELLVLPTNKGTAVDALRMQLSASAVLFMGDGVSDESVFAHLHGPDVGIKIGPGETAAGYRVDEPIDAVRVLGYLLDTRRNWLYGERAVPIERHSMLANGRTVALVAPDSTVSWLCHPDPDSSAVFAELLGGTPAGHFRVAPAGRNGIPLGQRYRPGTMSVETRWSGLTVTDWLDRGVPPGDAQDAPEATSLVRVLSGTSTARVDFCPRPEYGQVRISLQPLGDGLLVLGSNEPICLYSPGVDWEISNDGSNDSARATVDLSAMGNHCELELRCGTHSLRPWPEAIAARQGRVERDWKDWAGSLRLPTVARDLVLRSALTLRGLHHQPSGSLLAAATTSLPEEMGGIRNWDYRYCWLRDGAMTARALVDLGSLAEAEAFLGWVDRCVERTGGHPERLHPLYTVDGHDLGPEAVIDTLPGYAGSRPVRIGNAANRQLQLDVFGPIADLIGAVVEARGSVTAQEWHVLEAMVEAVERRWHEPDHGLWEARLPPRHHVYSKVMCWLTVDRAIRIAEDFNGGARPGWGELRDRIGANVLEFGWHEQAGAYTVAYGFPEMDASSLWIGLSGLLPNENPRFLDTVLAIEADLRSGPTVYRYKWDDGLPGREGGFHICAAWMIEAYLRTGRRADAEELFEQMLDCAGPTGLLPEQYDPEAERGLGNHPQAYSHLGLIRCALLLDGTIKV
ncbi:MAG TPA: trehalose-phosphatase [Rugosimonospora sp.]|nr:trehalose-phosphatase [Rugosimonospora sp.]